MVKAKRRRKYKVKKSGSNFTFVGGMDRKSKLVVDVSLVKDSILVSAMVLANPEAGAAVVRYLPATRLDMPGGE